MEGLQLISTIHHGLRILFKNSFIHAESEDQSNRRSSATRSRSAPPEISSSGEITGETTLMVRNIPTKLSQTTFLERIGDSFDVLSIDFYYLPIDFKSGKNLGYCFVNFSTPSALKEFMRTFDGVKLVDASPKTLSIAPAKIQGKEKNYNLFKTSSVMTWARPEFRPMMKCQKCAKLCPLSNQGGVDCDSCYTF